MWHIEMFNFVGMYPCRDVGLIEKLQYYYIFIAKIFYPISRLIWAMLTQLFFIFCWNNFKSLSLNYYHLVIKSYLNYNSKNYVFHNKWCLNMTLLFRNNYKIIEVSNDLLKQNHYINITHKPQKPHSSLVLHTPKIEKWSGDIKNIIKKHHHSFHLIKQKMMMSDIVLNVPNFGMFHNSTINPLLNPVFLHGCVSLIQFLFLIFILVSLVVKRLRVDRTDVSKQSFGCLYYKQALFCCVSLSVFNLALCFWNSFYWYRNGWNDEKIVTLLHGGLGTLVWLFVCVYLHTIVSNSSTESRKYPFVLRFWWVCFFTVSCYSLVVDYVYYKKTSSSITMFFVSDSVSSFMGLFIFFVGLSYKSEDEGRDGNLEEPLLNSGSVSNKGEISSTYDKASYYLIIFKYEPLTTTLTSYLYSISATNSVPSQHHVDNLLFLYMKNIVIA